MRIAPYLTLAFVLALPANSSAVELTKEAADAFDHYIADFESQLTPRLHGNGFLRLNASPEQRQQLKNGEVLVAPAKNNGETEVRAGIIHDWIGTVFIPGATLANALTIVQDYAHNKDYYAPDIADAKVRSQHGSEEFNVYMRIVKSKFMITDVLNTEHDVKFTQVDPKRVYCSSRSTRIAEVTNPGKAGERELPVGNDRGLLWRMYGYWFFEERDGGVYIEYESITLSRDIPFGLGKVLGPILHNVPAESLRSSLEKTRRAVATVAGRKTS